MDEKIRILKMVEEGKLSAEQAVDLIDALSEPAPAAEEFGATMPAVSDAAPYENKMLRVVVDSTTGDKVNVQLPVKIIRQVLKVTGKLPIKNEELQGIDLDALTTAILECLDNETLGNIVEVSAADGTTVRVFIG